MVEVLEARMQSGLQAFSRSTKIFCCTARSKGVLCVERKTLSAKHSDGCVIGADDTYPVQDSKLTNPSEHPKKDMYVSAK
eukprot:scaffold496574_cov38-Prasinocladus_malaysianus.AAC.2